MKHMTNCLKLAALTAACWVSTGHSQSAYFHYFSEPGDVVGRGQTGFITVPNDTVFVPELLSKGSKVMLTFNANGKESQVDLYAPKGLALQVGHYYFAEHAGARTGRAPGISVIVAGYGCLTMQDVLGHFSIQQIEFDANDSLQKLEANFTYQCSADAPMLQGYINYNAPPMALSLRSEPGDTVGQGVQKDYFNDTSIFTLNEDAGEQLRYQGSGLRDWWLGYLTPPVGTHFEAGRTYSTAFYANDTDAGLDFSFRNSRCHYNTSHGTLTVHALERDANGKVKAIWADFEQWCEGSSAPLRGTIAHGI